MHVALLRGVNVAGNNRLPMKDLAALFEAAGCADVTTFIASGNVLFQTRASALARLPDRISDAIEKKFRFRPEILLRSAAELAAVVKGNPFLKEAEPRTLHVAFLADKPSAAAVAGLDPDRSPGDRYLVKGREIYMHLPNGMGRTKLGSSYFDTRLRMPTTVRNWNTVCELARRCAIVPS